MGMVAVIRNKKIAVTGLSGLGWHNSRGIFETDETETDFEMQADTQHSNKDIDSKRTKDNYALKKPVCKNLYKEFDRVRKERGLKGKIKTAGDPRQRSKICEFVVPVPAGCPKGMEDEYLKEAYEVVKKLAGGEENILLAVVHSDESNKHLHVDYLPVVQAKGKNGPEEKISCKEFWKGANSYGKLQDAFYAEMAPRWEGLERGERKIKDSEGKMISGKEYTEDFREFKVQQEKLKELKADLADLQPKVERSNKLLEVAKADLEAAKEAARAGTAAAQTRIKVKERELGLIEAKLEAAKADLEAAKEAARAGMAAVQARIKVKEREYAELGEKIKERLGTTFVPANSVMTAVKSCLQTASSASPAQRVEMLQIMYSRGLYNTPGLAEYCRGLGFEIGKPGGYEAKDNSLGLR